MKFDLEWLLELAGEVEADEAAERLTACGFLVEVRDRVDGGEVWEVEVTTNRPDAMNHRGLARELAVATGRALDPLRIELDEEEQAAAELAAVQIDAPELCSRYVARVVRGVAVGESPGWLRDRLERCGVRPINAIVDATNYVLLELGQPLHAFDLDKLAERRIVVRRARAGERLVTLDGEERALDPEALVIADGRRAVALAGIMGGADTEIGEATADILIESAHFYPLSVRRTARRLGMHTEASHRFERGADPQMAAVACDAAAALIARLAGGHVARGRIDVEPRPWQPTSLELSVARLSEFAGLAIDAAVVERILDGLGFAPRRDGDTMAVTPPSHRVDIERAADLYEEVIRHVGYDAVPAELPVLATRPGHRAASWERADRARDAAVSTGLEEVITFAFIDAEADEAAAQLPLAAPGAGPIPLANPLTVTQSVMRRALLPGLLAATRGNLNRGERSVAIFEQGRTFFAGADGPVESDRIGIAMAGVSSTGPIGFADLKGRVESLLERLGSPPVVWRRGGAPWFDEAEGAVLVLDGAVVGCAGLLAAGIAGLWELKQAVYAAELDVAAVARPREPVRFAALPRFPAVAADITVEHPVRLAFAELAETVRELAGERVESIDLTARFAGSGLPDDVVRTTLRLVYRHPERSLTQDEVNAAQADLRARLAERLGVAFA